jgi:CheY-like chemotaxis protein
LSTAFVGRKRLVEFTRATISTIETDEKYLSLGYIFQMQKENKKTVLIVDDNRDAADTLAMLIRIAGCDPLVAYDTESGIALAHERLPDIILHDMSMPIVNGYEAARRLRNDEKLAKTTLVAVTAYGVTEDRKRAKIAGFDIHMAKPIDFEALTEVLERSGRSN